MNVRINLAAHGFTHLYDKDFTDDGTRFTVWEYKGARFTKAVADGCAYISLDFSADSVPYEAFKRFGVNGDKYNGVALESVDVEDLKKIAESYLSKLEAFKKDGCPEADFEIAVSKAKHDIYEYYHDDWLAASTQAYLKQIAELQEKVKENDEKCLALKAASDKAAEFLAKNRIKIDTERAC